MLQARIAKAPRKSASIFISSRVSMKDINVFEQDIIKNEKIINALTYEARKLEIRRKEIEEPEMRLGLDGQLDSLRNAIRQADLDIKELKRKNIIRQKSILDEYSRQQSGKEHRELQMQLMNQLRKKEQLASKLTEIENTNLNAHATDPADFDAKLSDLVKIVKVIEKHNQETGNSIHLNLLYKSKLASLENISKRRDQHEQSFKAQYYKKLKDLENICDSISDLSKLMDQRENEVLESRKEIERLGKQLKQRTAAISNNNSINESSGFMLTELVNTHHHTRQERNSDAPTSRVATEVRQAKIWRHQDNLLDEIESNSDTVGKKEKSPLRQKSPSESIDDYVNEQFESPENSL